MGDNIIRTL